jgi:hypothetical protein
VPIAYESGAREDGDFGDPADRAISQTHPDHRKPIVQLSEVTFEELDALTKHFGKAIEWATRDKPNLLVMGARWLAIISVMRPKILEGMRIDALKKAEFALRGVLLGDDPLVTGDFFRRPLAWVRDCASLEQLGQRGYSLIYNMRNDLVDGITCAAIGAFKNDTRQATNKPVNDFRDTFSGIKSLTMRDEETRKKCRLAQS